MMGFKIPAGNKLTCQFCTLLRLALPIAAGILLTSHAFAQGTQPNLDLPAVNDRPTGIQELDAVEPTPAELAAPVQASANDQNYKPAIHEPAVTPAGKAAKEIKNLKPVAYTPLQAIAIFPVVKHGNEKAFGDLPLVFAREYAQRMEGKAPDTKVYHPIYTVDEIRMRGMGHVYDQIMDYYIKAGRPEPAAMDYLLKQLAQDGKTISRVIFVEADLDMTHPDDSTGPMERVNHWLTDATPSQMKYFVNSRLQVFDAENPSFPMLWGGSWRRSIKTNTFFNVTPSVFSDSDSQQAFSKVSREMSRELLFLTPKEVYMAPQYDTSVQGELVSKKEPAFPNFTETKGSNNRLSDENMKAIQRILQRQNSISP